MNATEEDIGNFNKRLKEFCEKDPPGPCVTVLSLVFLGLIWILDQFHVSFLAQLLANHRLERLLYLGYFMILVSMWVVYFLSRTRFKTRTLRYLLSQFAEEWQPGSPAVHTRDKARASMTMLSLLTAGSALLMTQSLNHINSHNSSLPVSDLLDIWKPMLLYASAAASAIALICFIIAVDSLDVLFNHFGDEQGRLDNHMVQFFYLSKRNARYYGIMFFLWAACLFSGSFNPLFGALVVGIVILVGWSHWFPSPPLLPEATENNVPSVNLSLETSIRFGITVLPLLWALQLY